MLRLLTTSKTPTTAHSMYNRRLLWTTAAAALSTTTSTAFVLQPPIGVRTTLARQADDYPRLRTIRYFSSRNNNNNNNNGILSKIGGAVKSLLPTSWFGSEKEKKAAIARKQVRDDLKGNIKELLKDAPLPVRMMGSMISPLISTAMSGLAETMAEQQETVETYMNQARQLLVADPAVAQALGEPLQVGSPFSQSSSTSSINGQTTTRVELGFPVTGSKGSGVAQLSATNQGIQQLLVQAGGRNIAVSLTASSSSRKRFTSKYGNDDDDNIIEAEIIEKNTRR